MTISCKFSAISYCDVEKIEYKRQTVASKFHFLFRHRCDYTRLTMKILLFLLMVSLVMAGRFDFLRRSSVFKATFKITIVIFFKILKKKLTSLAID